MLEICIHGIEKPNVQCACKNETNQLRKDLSNPSNIRLRLIHEHGTTALCPDKETVHETNNTLHAPFLQDGVNISTNKDLLQANCPIGDLVHIALQHETLFVCQMKEANESVGRADIP